MKEIEKTNISPENAKMVASLRVYMDALKNETVSLKAKLKTAVDKLNNDKKVVKTLEGSVTTLRKRAQKIQDQIKKSKTKEAELLESEAKEVPPAEMQKEEIVNETEARIPDDISNIEEVAGTQEVEESVMEENLDIEKSITEEKSALNQKTLSETPIYDEGSALAIDTDKAEDIQEEIPTDQEKIAIVPEISTAPVLPEIILSEIPAIKKEPVVPIVKKEKKNRSKKPKNAVEENNVVETPNETVLTNNDEESLTEPPQEEVPQNKEEIVVIESPIHIEITEEEPGSLVITNSAELATTDCKEQISGLVKEFFVENEAMLLPVAQQELGKNKISLKEKTEWLKNKIAGVFDGVKSRIKKNIFTESGKQIMRKGVMIMTFTLSSIASAEPSMEKGGSSIQVDMSTEANAKFDREYIQENVVDMGVYDSLSVQGKQVYLDLCAGIYTYNDTDELEYNNKAYIIIDKQTAKQYVMNADNTLIACFPVLLGAAKGETQNRADVNSDHPGAHATTPMGEYEFNYSPRPIDAIYEGRIFTIYGVDVTDGLLGMHETYPGELVERTRALNTQTIEDNRKSYGCINLDQEIFDQYLTPHFTDGGFFKIYIMPDDPNQAFIP